MDKDLQNLLSNISWIRKKNKLSKKEMAELLGIGLGSFNKIERGELPPRLGVNCLLQIYKCFKIPPTTLLEKCFNQNDAEEIN